MRKRSPELRKNLIRNLKASPDKIGIAEVAVENRHMLSLLELSCKETKKDALCFAISYTIKSLRGNIVPKDSLEDKLEKLRYGEKAAHEASNELLDANAANEHYQGKFKC